MRIASLLLLLLCAVASQAAVVPPRDSVAGKAYMEALKLAEAGKLEEADEAFLTAIDAEPQFGAALFNRAVLLHDRGLSAAAEAAYRAALETDLSFHYKVRHNLGMLLSEAGKVEAAQRVFTQLVDAADGDVEQTAEGKFRLALLARTAHRLADAEALLREVVALQPTHANGLSELGELLHSLGDAEGEAEWLLQDAISAAPDNDAHYGRLALVYADTGKLEAAANASAKALALNPHNTLLRHAYSKLLARLGRTDAAKLQYGEAQKSAFADNANFRRRLTAVHRHTGLAVGEWREENGVKMTRLANKPALFHLDSFLSDEECDYLRNYAQPKMALSQSAFGLHAYRNSKSAMLGSWQADDKLTGIAKRTAGVMRVPFDWIWRTLDFQVVWYEEDKRHFIHQDSGLLFRRAVSIFVYLNDVEEGGATVFPFADRSDVDPSDHSADNVTQHCDTGIVQPPRKGDALLWYNYNEAGELDDWARHGGCDVIRGEKWGANLWFHLNGDTAGLIDRHLQDSQA
eukprot:PLAT3592.1.p1 GENE.PLAT3592.1~~PLAT3592.1.p1  ORF type:complete len:537 (-),score=227.73 PLAT3592.1:71-1624(-)